MNRGKLYSGSVAASTSTVINFPGNEKLKTVHINYGGGTPAYTLKPDNLGPNSSRNQSNADYDRAASLVYEHKFDTFYSSLNIDNTEPSNALNYSIYTEEQLT